MITLLVTVSACSSPTPASRVTSTSTSTSTSGPTTSVTVEQGSSAEVANCESDAKTVETALAAYSAAKGAYPTPPTAWSAAAYAGNFAPLIAGGGGGPFLPSAPPTAFYVIEYDVSGHVWVAPPGSYGTTFDPGQSFDANEEVCSAAVR